MHGRWFSPAISWARRCFLTVIGVVGSALHRGVVGDHHALRAGHAPDPGDQAGGRGDVVVEFVARKLADLEKGRPCVE